jgi:GH18 family chitinase
VSPEDLNLDGFTHLNFAFVFFNPTTFEIVPMDKNAGELLSRFTKLKEKKSGLQTWVSVGGWSFNDRKSLALFVNVCCLHESNSGPMAAGFQQYG